MQGKLFFFSAYAPMQFGFEVLCSRIPPHPNPLPLKGAKELTRLDE